MLDVDSLKTSTNVLVSQYLLGKEDTSLSHWHFEGKVPKFSRSALYVRCSCFKNLAFPCRQGQGTTLTEFKACKRPKRIHTCIYSSVDSCLLSLISQLSCTKPLRTFTYTRTCLFDMHTIFLLVNITLLKNVKSQRSYGFLIKKKLILASKFWS